MAMVAQAALSLTRYLTMAVVAAGAELWRRAGLVKLRPKVRMAALAAFAVAALVGVTGTTATMHLVQAEAVGVVLAGLRRHGSSPGRTAARVTSAAGAAAALAMAEMAVSGAVAAADTRTTFTSLAGTAALAVVVEAQATLPPGGGDPARVAILVAVVMTMGMAAGVAPWAAPFSTVASFR